MEDEPPAVSGRMGGSIGYDSVSSAFLSLATKERDSPGWAVVDFVK